MLAKCISGGHRGILPATVVMSLSNTICSLLCQFLLTVWGLSECRWRQTEIDQATNQSFFTDGWKISL